MLIFLQNHTAYPLFVLYRAIKHVSESGPVDVFTGRSRYSLNFERILQEDTEFNALVSFYCLIQMYVLWYLLTVFVYLDLFLWVFI